MLNLHPGINDGLNEQLKIKLNSFTNYEKECVLMWDEMKIRPGFNYNLKDDFIEGFENLNIDENSIDLKIATSVLVFMVGGLSHNWKQPFAYYPCNGTVMGPILKNLILSVVENLSEIGFKVRHMVCDLGKPNQKAVSLLGITSETPFITVHEQKISFGYDGPHVTKCIRNGLMKNDFKIGKEIVSWQTFVEL